MQTKHLKNPELYLGFGIYECIQPLPNGDGELHEYICLNLENDRVNRLGHTREELKEWIQHFHSSPEQRDFYNMAFDQMDAEALVDPAVYDEELAAFQKG